jgi:hypothetical protein
MTPDVLTAATSAFAAGDWKTARGRLEALDASGQADAEALALMAAACAHLDDAAAAHAAAERAVVLNARNLRAVPPETPLTAQPLTPRTSKVRVETATKTWWTLAAAAAAAATAAAGAMAASVTVDMTEPLLRTAEKRN